MTCQPLMFTYDGRSKPAGYVARCACGFIAAPEPDKRVATQVLQWHLNETPREKAHRQGLVVVRQRGAKTAHVMKWLGDSTLCGVSVTRVRDEKFGDITCEKCLKAMDALADTTV